MTPEGRVKAIVKKALDTQQLYCFMPVQNGMGKPGLDYFCCANGLFVAIETKVPGKELTPRQRGTAEEIARAGGMVFVVRDAADVEAMMKAIKYWTSICHRDRGRAGFINDTMGERHA